MGAFLVIFLITIAVVGIGVTLCLAFGIVPFRTSWVMQDSDAE